MLGMPRRELSREILILEICSVSQAAGRLPIRHIGTKHSGTRCFCAACVAAARADEIAPPARLKVVSCMAWCGGWPSQSAQLT
jgi:hypothetical protein